MSMFYLFFGIEKKVLLEKNTLGVKKNSIDIYMWGKTFLKGY